MINTVKKETSEKAKLLLNVIEQRKHLEKLEKELKNDFKALLGSEVAINASGILISLDSRNRTSLDKEALKAVIDLSPFEKVSSYQVMSVKKVG